jgi:hypothetical protein
MPKDTPTPFGMKVEFVILLIISGAGVVAAIGFVALSAYRWLLG